MGSMVLSIRQVADHQGHRFLKNYLSFGMLFRCACNSILLVSFHQQNIDYYSIAMAHCGRETFTDVFPLFFFSFFLTFRSFHSFFFLSPNDKSDWENMFKIVYFVWVIFSLLLFADGVHSLRIRNIRLINYLSEWFSIAAAGAFTAKLGWDGVEERGE